MHADPNSTIPPPEGLPSWAEIQASESYKSTYHSSLTRRLPRHSFNVFTRGCDSGGKQLADANRQAYKRRKHVGAIRRGMVSGYRAGDHKHRRELNYWAQRTAGGSSSVTSGAMEVDSPPGGVNLSRGRKANRSRQEKKKNKLEKLVTGPLSGWAGVGRADCNANGVIMTDNKS